MKKTALLLACLFLTGVSAASRVTFAPVTPEITLAPGATASLVFKGRVRSGSHIQANPAGNEWM